MNNESRTLNVVIIALVVMAIAVIWFMAYTVPVWISVGTIASVILVIVFLFALWMVSK